jgi:hypothetical protein
MLPALPLALALALPLQLALDKLGPRTFLPARLARLEIATTFHLHPGRAQLFLSHILSHFFP